MSEFLDRVAMAIAGNEWNELPAPVREVRRHEARAAIAAMRVPSEAMQMAGHNRRTHPATGLPTHCGTDEIYTAMIDAALRESWD